MMLLNDSKIAEYIEDDKIGVKDPGPTPEQVQPASLDTRIGETLYDPWTDEPLDTMVIEPMKRYHAYTMSRHELPNDLGGFLTGRSSLGRRGMVIHLTAGWIDPGFRGNIKYELINLSSEPYEFEPGERIGQLIYMMLIEPSEGYDGQYQDQES